MIQMRKNILTFLSRCSSLEELVENMETPLFWSLSEGSGLFQEVELDVGSRDVARHVEVDTDELSLENG